MAEDRDKPTVLMWLDCETTGLDPRVDYILEIAWGFAPLHDPFTVTGLQSVVIGHRGNWLRDDSDSFVQKMHDDNGLWIACAMSNVSMGAAADRVVSTMPPDVTIVAAGSCVSFDTSFLRADMPDVYARLSHRAYDVSAARLFLESCGMPRPAKLPPAHRAEADVRQSIEIARSFAQWVGASSAREPAR